MLALGQHALLDLYDCDVGILGDVVQLQNALLTAAQSVQATVLFQHFHHFGEGAGVTGVLLLAESHISIHTWTEYAAAAVDMFVCGGADNLQAACQLLSQTLQAKHYHLSIQSRGNTRGNHDIYPNYC